MRCPTELSDTGQVPLTCPRFTTSMMDVFPFRLVGRAHLAPGSGYFKEVGDQIFWRGNSDSQSIMTALEMRQAANLLPAQLCEETLVARMCWEVMGGEENGFSWAFDIPLSLSFHVTQRNAGPARGSVVVSEWKKKKANFKCCNEGVILWQQEMESLKRLWQCP